MRHLGYTIDTGLLTTWRCCRLTILPAALNANGWLLVKIALLDAAALLAFAQMYFIARMHHPFGAVLFMA